MDIEEQLAFNTEWDDPQSGLKKGYILHYHGDNTIELVDRKTKKIFLKRIRISTLNLDNLYVGSSITVYSRQLVIMKPANEFTRKMLQQREDKFIFVISRDGYSQMGRILHLIEQSAKLESLTTITENNQQQFLSDGSVLFEAQVSDSKLIEGAKLKLISGNIDTVLVVKAGFETFYSGQPASNPFPTTAVLDNCTLCLIRPRILREACTGEILDAILTAGFEISALKLVHLKMEEADELFQIYKGVVRQYHEMLKYMCSSPCLALEVRGEDVVHHFRDFCGPFDVEVAKILQPQSPDCIEDGVLECQYVFKTLPP